MIIKSISLRKNVSNQSNIFQHFAMSTKLNKTAADRIQKYGIILIIFFFNTNNNTCIHRYTCQCDM